MLGVRLRAVTDGRDEAFEGDGTAVGQARGEGLLLHEVGKDTGVGCQAGERETEVLIDGDDFLLVGGELFCVALGSALALSSTVFEVVKTRRGSTFNATSTACVLLTIPTTTLPCLTASLAYSTWNIRP